MQSLRGLELSILAYAFCLQASQLIRLYFSPNLASACDYTFGLHSRSCRQPTVFLGEDITEGSCAREMYSAAAVLVRKVPERGDASSSTSRLTIHPTSLYNETDTASH